VNAPNADRAREDRQRGEAEHGTPARAEAARESGIRCAHPLPALFGEEIGYGSGGHGVVSDVGLVQSTPAT